jgi:hypothetical protein
MQTETEVVHIAVSSWFVVASCVACLAVCFARYASLDVAFRAPVIGFTAMHLVAYGMYYLVVYQIVGYWGVLAGQLAAIAAWTWMMYFAVRSSRTTRKRRGSE